MQLKQGIQDFSIKFEKEPRSAQHKLNIKYTPVASLHGKRYLNQIVEHVHKICNKLLLISIKLCLLYGKISSYRIEEKKGNYKRCWVMI